MFRRAPVARVKPFGGFARCAFRTTRALRCPASSSGGVIDEDMLTVEFIETDRSFQGGVVDELQHHGSTQQPSSSSFTEYETIPLTTPTDTFARARVANFVKRYAKKDVGASPFVTNAEDGIFHSRITLPMPSAEYGDRCGEGRASDAKEAEHLASMHAERIINSLGLQLCALPSAQERYANSVRKQGGWAPLPSDERRSPHTPSPPGLQRPAAASRGLSSSSTPSAPASAAEPFNIFNESQFTNVFRGSSGVRGVLSKSIASASMLDVGAYRRIRSMVEERGVSYSKVARMVKVSTKNSSGPLAGTVVRRDDGQADDKQRNFTAVRKGSVAADMEASSKGDLYLCEILIFEAWIDPASPYYNPDAFEGSSRGGHVPGGRKLLDSASVASLINGGGGAGLFQPLHAATSSVASKLFSTAEKAGRISCRGVAYDSKTAQHLAAMHAELIADALGIYLFLDPAEQYEHYQECSKVGRWCINPEEGKSRIVTSMDGGGANSPFLIAQTIKPMRLALQGEEATSPPSVTHSSTTLEDGSASLFSTNEIGGQPQSDVRNINSHMTAIDYLTRSFINIGMVDPDANRHLKQYLRVAESTFDSSGRNSSSNHGGDAGASPSYINLNTGDINFFVAQFGLGGANNKGATTYRASLQIPVPNESYYGVRYAVGIASSVEEAQDLCAMHALTVLGSLEIPIYAADVALQSQYYEGMMAVGGVAAHPDFNERIRRQQSMEDVATSGSVSEVSLSHVPSPAAFKVVSRDKRGRIFFGISRADEALEWGDQQHRRKSEEVYDYELHQSRSRMRPSFWALSPDVITPSGPRIIIPSTTPVDSKRTFIHTGSGVRYPDSRAADRLTDYLERAGRQGDSYQLTSFEELDDVVTENTSDGTTTTPDVSRRTISWRRITVTLPVPEHFGVREAIGEGATPEQALQCAAMHAEIVLDEIGVRLYDHDVYQRQHSECARSVGRWAPLPDTVISYEGASSKPTPCPIRAAIASTRIDNVALKVIEARDASPNYQSATTTGASSHSDVDPNQESVSSPPPLSQSEMSRIPAAPKTSSSPSNASTSASSVFTDGRRYIPNLDAHLKTVTPSYQSGWEVEDTSSQGDVEDGVDITRYTTVSMQETGLSARNRVETFFEENNGDITSIDRFSAKVDGRALHFASIVLPLPPQFGIRKARGCAVSRRDALVNCMNHAEFVIGDLGVCIHGSRRNAQIQYHHAMKRKGRRAPLPGEPLQPPTTLSTYGLKTIQDASEITAAPLFSAEQLEEAGLVASSSHGAFNSGGASGEDHLGDEEPMETISEPPTPTSFSGMSISSKADYELPAIKQAMERWDEHCIKVGHYIVKKDKQKLVIASQQMKSPRTGVPIEDSASEVMEALLERKGLNRSAHGALQAAASRDGYEIPASFDVMEVGFGSTRAFYSSTAVLGTPYNAFGLAEKRHDALCTAMTHYRCIMDLVAAGMRKAKTAAAAGLTRAVGAAGGSGAQACDEADDTPLPMELSSGGDVLGTSGTTAVDALDLNDAFAVASVVGWGDVVFPNPGMAETSTSGFVPTLPPALEIRRLLYARSAAAKLMLYDDVKEAFSLRGKLLIVSLFTRAFIGGREIKESCRILDVEDGSGTVTVICTLGLEDEVGLKLSAKGKEVVKKLPIDASLDRKLEWDMAMKGIARRKAYEELFTVLSSKRQFGDLMQLVKASPDMRLEFASGVSMTPDVVASVKAVVLGERPPTITTPASSSPAAPSRPGLGGRTTPTQPGSRQPQSINSHQAPTSPPSMLDSITYDRCRRSYLSSVARRACEQINSTSATSPSGGSVAAFLAGTVSKETMPEEYALLLASFASGRPLADVGALEERCKEALGSDLTSKLVQSDDVDQKNTIHPISLLSATPIFAHTTIDKVKDATSTVLDIVDSKCVHMDTRQIIELQQSHFVEVVEVPLGDLDAALRAKVVAGTPTQGGPSPSSSSSLSVRKIQQYAEDGAAPMSAPPTAVSGALTQLRKATLHMAVPTLNGGLCIRLASLVLKHNRRAPTTSSPSDSSIATAGVHGEYTRAEIVSALHTSKLLINGLITGAYDLCLTACSVDEGAFDALVNHYSQYPEQLSTSVKAGETASAPDGTAVDGSFTVTDIIVSTTDALQRASSVSSPSARRPHQVQLTATRKALHELVQQCLKELSGNVVLGRLYPQIKELLSVAQRVESPQSAFAMKAQGMSASGATHILTRRAVFDSTVALSLSPAFSLTTLRGVRKLEESQRLLKEQKDKQAQDAHRAETERLAAEDKAKKASEEAAAAVGLTEYIVPKGGVLRVSPEALVALTKAAHSTTTASTTSAVAQSTATTVTPSTLSPTPKPPASTQPISPQPQGGAVPWGAQPPSSWSTVRQHQGGGGGGWSSAAKQQPRSVSATTTAVGSKQQAPLANTKPPSSAPRRLDDSKIVTLGMEEHQYARIRLPLLAHAKRRTTTPKQSTAPVVLRPEVFIENPSVLALFASDCVVQEPLSVQPTSEVLSMKTSTPTTPTAPASPSSAPQGRLLCVGGQMVVFSNKDENLAAFELVRQKSLEQIRTVRPWGEPFKGLIRKLLQPTKE